jgi:translation initiation factor 3 subunit J
MAAALEDPKLVKERSKAAELQSDLKNASDLFAEMHVHPRERANKQEPVAAMPTKLSDLPLFKPKTKQDFDNLRKTLVPLLTSLQEKNSLQFANFITDFCRDCCKPLSSDQSRKVASTISAVSNEKQREERLNRGKKQKPMVKQASLKVNEDKDTTNYGEFEDDDDDFM